MVSLSLTHTHTHTHAHTHTHRHTHTNMQMHVYHIHMLARVVSFKLGGKGNCFEKRERERYDGLKVK